MRYPKISEISQNRYPKISEKRNGGRNSRKYWMGLGVKKKTNKTKKAQSESINCRVCCNSTRLIGV